MVRCAVCTNAQFILAKCLKNFGLAFLLGGAQKLDSLPSKCIAVWIVAARKEPVLN